MAFIAMMFAGVALIIVLIGLLFFSIALILDVICFIRARKKKKNHIAFVIITVLINIAGFLMFVLPVGGLLFSSKINKYKAEKRFNAAEYKVYVEENEKWESGFEYKGIELVSIDFLVKPNEEALKEEGVVCEDGKDKHYISYVENSGGFDIYCVERAFHPIFCNKNQVDEIKEYYYNSEHLDSEISSRQKNNGMSVNTDLDPGKVFEIRELYDNHGDGICYGNTDDLGDSYSIVAFSKDGLFYESVSIDEYNGRLLLGRTFNMDSFSAIYLPRDLEEYVREAVEELD